MPNNKNRNKNKNFNRNRHYQNGGGHSGGGGGGGQGRHGVHNNGIQKWPRGGKHTGNRHIYINPTAIESLDDNYETEAPHSSNYNQNNRYRSDDRGKKNRVINRLKEMGNVKPKLSIGDTDQEVKKTLLESKPHCQLSTVPSDVFQLIVTYIQKYFTCFDSNRESLLEAYHSKCTFSFAINLNNPEAHRSFKFDDFLYKENRNLKRISGLDETHHDKRYKLLHQGKIETVSFLNKMPPTEHEPTSFKLDCCFFTPAMISFSLNGVYREGKPTDKVRPFRSFQRIFVCIPDPNTQMSIINEEFIMANMSREQYQKYYASLESAPKQDQVEPVAPVPQQVQPTSQPSTILQPIAQNLTQEQLLMIEQFSRESRLNMEWSKHCLDHSQWNFEEAAKQFLIHKDKLPKDAFLV